MYTLRPIITPTDVCPRAKTMYEMRKIYMDDVRRREDVHREHDAKMSDVITEQTRLPEFTTLEARQEEILNQLTELKKQVSILRSFLKRPIPEIVEKEVTRDCKPQEAINFSLILNVDPSRPPYSIYALQKLWKDVNIRVESYVHSSIVGPVPVAFPNSANFTSNNIKLSLIYKSVSNLELITGLHSYPIVGEVNFLRYLSRLIDTHNYERYDIAYMHAIDGILDSCCRVHQQTSHDKMGGVLSALHTRLEETHWTGKGEPSIADIAAWSTVKQLSLSKRLPQCLNEWYEYCEKVFMDKILTH